MAKLDTLIKWEFESHFNMTKEHALMETSTYKDYPIRRETHTPVTKYGKFGKPKVIYWTPSDKKNYDTLEELLQAIDSEVE